VLCHGAIVKTQNINVRLRDAPLLKFNFYVFKVIEVIANIKVSFHNSTSPASPEIKEYTAARLHPKTI
jgi:hypothetical protein